MKQKEKLAAFLTKMSKVQRKWQKFPGKNKFLCNGRLVMAKQTGVFYVTVLLIVVTSGLFFAFDCPFLAVELSPAIPVVAGLLFLFVMSSLFRTSCIDPGIIPRAIGDEAAYIERQIEVPNNTSSPMLRPPPRTKEVVVCGQVIKLKYCSTCRIFRPPRASHCSICDNCVERFDHHCPWVGNCVGRRNYRFFYSFIVSLAVYCVYIFACSVTHLIMLTSKDSTQLIDAIKDSPTSLIVTVICFFSVWSVLGLAGFHSYLITSNQTTNEDIKGSFTGKRGQEKVNPYSHGGMCNNCFYVLCGPYSPSLIDGHGIYAPESESRIMSVLPSPEAKDTAVMISKGYGTVKVQPTSSKAQIQEESSSSPSEPFQTKRKAHCDPLNAVIAGDASGVLPVLVSETETKPRPKAEPNLSKSTLNLPSHHPAATNGGLRTALSASQLLLLQERTMINTELDLDSLDGSMSATSHSGSQAGLLKVDPVR